MVKANILLAVWNLELSVDEDNEHMEVNDNDKMTITVKWPYHAESIKNYLTIWAIWMFTKVHKNWCVLTSAHYSAAVLLSLLI
jgi:hypothetical protein